MHQLQRLKNVRNCYRLNGYESLAPRRKSSRKAGKRNVLEQMVAEDIRKLASRIEGEGKLSDSDFQGKTKVENAVDDRTKGDKYFQQVRQEIQCCGRLLHFIVCREEARHERIEPIRILHLD
mmetsp:Transcript_237/g.648  ORF Transcript_237/g.648 Transcript_237/m.648 type:complete len:122 (+) Transcript_237:117-482(+)